MNSLKREFEFKKILINLQNLTKQEFVGNYKSVFKGEGIEFYENREYQYGDSLKNINWFLSAKQNKLYTKVYHEERNVDNFIILDYSSSMFFKTIKQTKYIIASDIALIIAYSSSIVGDRFGLVLFGDKILKFFPLGTGMKHFFTIYNFLKNYIVPESKITDFDSVFTFTYRILKKRANIFIISDFIGFGLKERLKILTGKHKVVGISVNDPFEVESHLLKNYKSQSVVSIEGFQLHNYEDFKVELDHVETEFLRYNCDFLKLTTSQKYYVHLKEFLTRKIGNVKR